MSLQIPPNPCRERVPLSGVNQERGLWEVCPHQLGGWKGFLEEVT